MERNRHCTEIISKNELLEVGKSEVVNVRQELMQFPELTIDMALANSMLDAREIDFVEDNSGSSTTFNVGTNLGKEGLSAGFQICRKKVVNRRIRIRR